MPRVKSFKARKKLYRIGIQVPANTKSGFKVDRTQPNPDGDSVFCEAGQIYYTWKFRYGGAHRSTVYPRPSQLTQSEYLSTGLAIMEEIEDMSPGDFEDWGEVQSKVEDLVMQLEELRDQAQESLDNMQEHFSGGETVELLERRVEAVDEAISELESIDCDQSREMEDIVEDIQNITLELE